MAILIDSVGAKKEADFFLRVVREFTTTYIVAAKNQEDISTISTIEIPLMKDIAEIIIPDSYL